ncbi:MAG: hypothetical protein ACLGJD_11120, partial [Gammaproteobacteria bacterium]
DKAKLDLKKLDASCWPEQLAELDKKTIKPLFTTDFTREFAEIMLLRVPGLGVRAVQQLVAARRHRRLRAEDLRRLRVPVARVMPFVQLDGHRPARALESPALRATLSTPAAPVQASLV